MTVRIVERIGPDGPRPFHLPRTEHDDAAGEQRPPAKVSALPEGDLGVDPVRVLRSSSLHAGWATVASTTWSAGRVPGLASPSGRTRFATPTRRNCCTVRLQRLGPLGH